MEESEALRGTPITVTQARKILSVGHSYCVALNRRLPNELARVGGDRWAVTTVAPESFPGDLGPIKTVRDASDVAPLELVPVHFAKFIHVMSYGRRLRKLLREPWDIVHVWEEPYIYAGGQIARWSPPGSRVVFASFQNIPKRYPPPFAGIERAAMKRAAGWIAYGQTVLGALAQKPCYLRKPHEMIPPGVDTEHFKPDASMRAKTLGELAWNVGEAPVVGFLGRFVAEKGIADLTRRLDAIRSPWRALFVGGGPLLPEVQAWAERYPENVRIITGVAHEDVPRYLNAMDMLCAPSRTTPRWREQFGRMLIEAFACGVPVIASDSGEIPHVVGNAGLICHEGSDSAWTSALVQLLSSPAERKRIGTLGLERARNHFAWPIIAGRTLDFFESLL